MCRLSLYTCVCFWQEAKERCYESGHIFIIFYACACVFSCVRASILYLTPHPCFVFVFVFVSGEKEKRETLVWLLSHIY